MQGLQGIRGEPCKPADMDLPPRAGGVPSGGLTAVPALSRALRDCFLAHVQNCTICLSSPHGPPNKCELRTHSVLILSLKRELITS